MQYTIGDDPKAKRTLLQHFEALLFEKHNEEFKERLTHIIDANDTLQGVRAYSFGYRGQFHRVFNIPEPRVPQKLHRDLWPTMDTYLKDKREIDSFEIPLAMGYVNAVLNHTKLIGDYLKLLPPATHRALERCYGMECVSQAEGIMTDEQVQAFMDRNRFSLGKLKARLVWNLIT